MSSSGRGDGGVDRSYIGGGRRVAGDSMMASSSYVQAREYELDGLMSPPLEGGMEKDTEDDDGDVIQQRPAGNESISTYTPDIHSTGFTTANPSSSSNAGRKLSYLLHRHLRSRSTRTFLLILGLIFLLLSLLKSSHPHFIFNLPFTRHSSLHLSTTSPFVSPSTSSSPLTTSSSLTHSTTWGLTGIPGTSLGPSLDDRLRALLDKPELMQWEMEVLNRHECPFYTYDRNSECDVGRV
jgi:hypothetical protein